MRYMMRMWIKRVVSHRLMPFVQMPCDGQPDGTLTRDEAAEDPPLAKRCM